MQPQTRRVDARIDRYDSEHAQLHVGNDGNGDRRRTSDQERHECDRQRVGQRLDRNDGNGTRRHRDDIDHGHERHIDVLKPAASSRNAQGVKSVG